MKTIPDPTLFETEAARRMLDTIIILRERWFNAQQKEMRFGDHFTKGRCNGYEQAIALLLGSTQTDVRAALLAGDL